MDNTELDPGSGGDVVRTKDRTGTKTQIVALDLNPAGAESLMAGAMPVTDNAGSLTVDDGGSSLTVDGTVTVSDGGGSVTVDGSVGITGALPAGTNAIGKLAANSGVDIGDVDVTSLPSLPAGNNNIGDVDVATLPSLPAGNNSIGDVDVATLPGSLAGIADDAAFTVASTPVLPVGYLADQASTDSVNEGDIGAARMTLDRKQIVVAAPSVDTEGYSVVVNTDIDESEDAVKTSAGKLHGWFLYNDGSAEVYVKFYNDTVANVVVGTTAPLLTLPIPAGAAANLLMEVGVPFSAAITIAATTGAGTTDVGAPATGQVVGSIFYV